MTSNLMLLAPLMIIIPLLSIIMVNHHLLSVLLNLEAAMLGMMLFMIYLMFGISSTDSINILLLLTMGACEASMGLALISIMSRSQGSDNLTSSTTFSC
uniref:NADH-ubiquinone oxidoreductase chain 4L n=1 Tax=Ramisyllis multicaudata TaxID=1166726 RepID=A0A0K0YD55_RAMMU|nr:NADH dehydrogenase subunit 4L [Ramisyllis multicaudata]AKS48917.1 NADH dehydrogenase subunit 4L [Ramisyllis multicaudata]